MVNTARIARILGDENPDAIVFDGLEDALVGIARRQYQGPWAVYSRSKLLEVLELQLGTADDALEWLEYNVVGLWAGEQTPLILDDCDDELFDELDEQLELTDPPRAVS